jgi:hypothetical protein
VARESFGASVAIRNFEIVTRPSSRFSVMILTEQNNLVFLIFFLVFDSACLLMQLRVPPVTPAEWANNQVPSCHFIYDHRHYHGS